MTTYFIANERFDATSPRWAKYIEWSQLKQLNEVVSLDRMLCPPVITDIDDDMWNHIVNEDFMLDYFTDLEFMLLQLKSAPSVNVLAVSANPPRDGDVTVPDGFSFVGFDLVERMTGVSALTNCGGFRDVFDNSELSEKGLLQSHTRAMEVQRNLRIKYPEDPHANCDAWAIFRSETLSRTQLQK